MARDWFTWAMPAIGALPDRRGGIGVPDWAWDFVPALPAADLAQVHAGAARAASRISPDSRSSLRVGDLVFCCHLLGERLHFNSTVALLVDRSLPGRFLLLTYRGTRISVLAHQLAPLEEVSMNEWDNTMELSLGMLSLAWPELLVRALPTPISLEPLRVRARFLWLVYSSFTWVRSALPHALSLTDLLWLARDVEASITEADQDNSAPPDRDAEGSWVFLKGSQWAPFPEPCGSWLETHWLAWRRGEASGHMALPGGGADLLLLYASTPFGLIPLRRNPPRVPP